MFEETSKYAETVDVAMLYITGFSILMLLLITVAMIYFVIRYRASKHPVPKQTHGNVVIEVIWIIIPTIIVISMFFYGYTDFDNLRGTEEFDEEYEVVAKMWEWDFNYSNGLKTDTLYVPQGKTLKFNLKSLDVLHSFYIPAYRIKEDAVPNRETYMVVTPEKLGKFDIACAEYCGQRHWDMYTDFVVLPQEEYYEWLDKALAEQEGGVSQPAESAEKEDEKAKEDVEENIQE